MSKKRSRVGHSQDIGLLNEHPSPELRLDSALPGIIPDQSRHSTLSVSSPALVCESVHRGGGFLDRCYQCKKMLDHAQDVYMYRDSSFCSLECRDVRITIDKAAGGTVTSTSSSGMNR